MKAFFCYERSRVDGHWQPALYYHEPPNNDKGNGRDKQVERTPILRMFEPSAFGLKNPRIMLLDLIEEFPPPKDEESKNERDPE